MVPAEFKNKVPIKFDYFIKDEELKSYLEAPKWTDKSGHIRVNPVVFESSTFSLPKTNMCPVVDNSLRDQLTIWSLMNSLISPIILSNPLLIFKETTQG